MSIASRAWRRPTTALLSLFALAGCSDRFPTGPELEAPLSPRVSAAAADLNATPSGYIRIGVAPEMTTLKLGATGSWAIRSKGTGDVLFTGTASDVAEVSLASRLVVVLDVFRLQVACMPQSALAAAEAEAARIAEGGYQTLVLYNSVSNCWRVLVGEFAISGTFGLRSAFETELMSKGYAPADGSAFSYRHTVTEGRTEYRVTRGSESKLSASQVVLQAPDALVRIEVIEGGQRVLKPYRGVAEAVANSRGSLAGVNEVRVEEYLYGVVPLELPPTVWGQMEAQKAQAVAARTYALRGINKRKVDGYDLLPTTSDQVYGGASAEHPVSSAAVDQTAGVVATHDGGLIDAVFSSTAGGFTADNEEAFSSDPIPYLRGIPDAERGEAFANVPTVEVFKNARNAASLRAYRPGDHEYDWSRYYRWTVDWTPAEMSRSISAFAGEEVGQVLAVNVLERGRSGRAVKIEYVTEKGRYTEIRDRIRSSLKFVNANGDLSTLFSTLFFIEPQVDPRTGAVTGWKAYGGGWGHGVGLSQTGAAGMAQKGRTYEEILKHYYRGISLETR